MLSKKEVNIVYSKIIKATVAGLGVAIVLLIFAKQMGAYVNKASYLSIVWGTVFILLGAFVNTRLAQKKFDKN
ncbi:hypothetical protein GOV04_01135 [Candidatus Woesearchaeota archaeon]|nr:hypothetical protein [Candidatus Woesearchaeota archaeon]